MFQMILEEAKTDSELSIACKRGDLSKVKEILKVPEKKPMKFFDFFPSDKSEVQSPVNTPDQNGYYPIHITAYKGDVNMMKELLKSGASIKQEDEETHYSPIHMASYSGSAQAVKFLLEQGADPNAEGQYLRTPLHIAAFKGSLEVIKELCAAKISCHLDAQTLENVGKETALHMAVFNRHKKVAEFLILKGADCNKKNKIGETPFFNKDPKEILQSLEGPKPIIETKQFVEEKKYVERCWHFDPNTERRLSPEDEKKEYVLLDATENDFRKIMEIYEMNPIPGYDICTVEVIYNKTFNKKFELELHTLNQRHGNSAFEIPWNNLPNRAWRETTYDLFTKLPAFTDPDFPHVKLFATWHGTDPKILDSLFSIGYENLRKTDKGWFGGGLYSTIHPEYAFKAYNKGTVIFNWVGSYLPLPVIDNDMEDLKLLGATNYGSCDTHFVPVVPKNPLNPNEKSFYPCKPNQPFKYIEIVTFKSGLFLPRCLVKFQPTLPKQPQLKDENENPIQQKGYSK